MTPLENQTLALAGMFQAALLADSLASSGKCDQDAFGCSFRSLFTFDAATSLEVFGDLSDLRPGFETLEACLGGDSRVAGRNIAYYVFSMLKLATRLLRDQSLAQELQRELHDIENNAAEYDLSRNNVIQKIDGLYQQNISQLSPRIMVRGEQNYLRNDDNAARIRTLLLAGVRAGVMWRQLGGNRWRLLWFRNSYVAAARHFLNSD